MLSHYFKRFALCLVAGFCACVGSFAQEAKIGDTNYETLAEAFAAATANQTVTLMKDVEVSAMIPVTQTMTLDLAGYTITNKVESNRLFRLSDVTFTIDGNNGSVITPEENTSVSYGFVDFRDASGVASEATRLVASNVSFKGGTNDGSLFAFRTDGQSLDFENVNVNLTGGHAYSIINGYRVSVDIKVKGGTYICRSTNQTAGVFQAGPFSTINFEGVTVDTSVGPIIEVIASDATFTNCNMVNTATNSFYATGIAVSNGGNVTIEGGSHDANYAAYVYNSGGTININGGTFKGNQAAVRIDRENDPLLSDAIVNINEGTLNGNIQNNGVNGVLNINGGEISGDVTATGTNSLVNITDGEVTGDIKATGGKSAIYVEGGTINGALSNNATNDSKIVVTGGTYTAENSNVGNYIDTNNASSSTEGGSVVVQKNLVAEVNGTKYTTLTEAINAANGATVKLIADFNEDVVVADGVTANVDLAGHTITNKFGDTFTVLMGGSLTIDNSTTTRGSVIVRDTEGKSCVYNNGTVVLNHGFYKRYKTENDVDDYSYCYLLNHGTMTIANKAWVGGTRMGGTGNVVMNGYEEYTSTDARLGHVEGTNAAEPKLIIDGGTFYGGLNTVVNASNGVAEINNGDFTNYDTAGAIMLNKNKLTINGGMFSGWYSNGCTSVRNENSVSDVNACELTVTGEVYTLFRGIVECGNKAIISGGTFSQLKVEEGHNPVISGGKFNNGQDVTKYCEEGYIATLSNGSMIVKAVGDYDYLICNAKGVSTDFKNWADAQSIALDDADLSRIAISTEADGVSVTYKRTYAGGGKWEALFLPFDITVPAAGFKFAEIWDTELIDGAATIEFVALNAGDVIPANTPCLIAADAAGEQTLTLASTHAAKTVVPAVNCSSIKKTFDFYGVHQNTDLLSNKGYYINPATQQFAWADAATTLKPGRFYMTVTDKATGNVEYGSVDAQSVRIRVLGDDSETTGIAQAPAASGNATVYNLQGVRVGGNSLRPGIYVKNGKKVIVK